MPRAGPISPSTLAFSARRERERRVAEVAAAQHGVVTLAQLRAIGFAPSTVRARVAAGRLHRLHDGVYAVGHPGVGAHGRWLAAVLACGPGAVLSHLSAAALWGIRPSQSTVIDVSSGTRAGRSRPGIRAHRGAGIAPAEITMVAGIPCTGIARTIVDVAALLAPGALEYTIHRAQTAGLLDREELAGVLARAPLRAGAGRVRRIVSLELPGEDRARSRLERRLLRICQRAGLPPPRVNAWIALDGGHGLEVDFCWPEQRLVVETDGATFHRTARALENDAARDRSLTLEGWRVVRFTDRQVSEDPVRVAAQLRRLLAA